MSRRLLRISDWPFLIKLCIGPGVALAVLGLIAFEGVGQIAAQSVTVDGLIRNSAATGMLADASKQMQAINGNMFRVLALQAAQTAGFSADQELKQLQGQVQAVTRILRQYRDNYATPAQQSELDGLVANIEKYQGAIDWVGQMLDVDFGSAVSFLKPFEATFADMNDHLTAMVVAVKAADRAAAQAASAAARRTRETFIWATGGSFVFVGLIALTIGPATVRSIRRIASATQDLAQGNTEVDTASLHRRDELGAIVRSLDVFRDGLLRVRTLQSEQEQQRAAAEQEKLAALVHMAETIETETRRALTEVGERSGAMQSTADAMQESAGRTGSAVTSAAGAATQALQNAQTVASAAEELAASIREIGGQVGQSTAKVQRAVEAGAETRATIETLNTQVAKIGAVADMIRDIAAKTNLLALNATIEAARAGEAGKGFAVVASEVKALAMQTARSTEDISHHIGEVRSATGASVAAVQRIEQTIEEVAAIATSIAAAIEEQNAATAEIARNVSETAAATNQMSDRISEVATEAKQTGHHASVVHDNTTMLTGAMSELQRTVIRMVRTSTAEVDRRKQPRFSVNLPARITVANGEAVAQLRDISEGGALISNGPPARPGDRGTLNAQAIGFVLPFVVRYAQGTDLHIAFELSEDLAERFHLVPERLGRSQAA